MPAAFERCVKAGGRVRTVSGPSKRWGLAKDQFMRICWDKGGTPHRGEKRVSTNSALKEGKKDA